MYMLHVNNNHCVHALPPLIKGRGKVLDRRKAACCAMSSSSVVRSRPHSAAAVGYTAPNASSSKPRASVKIKERRVKSALESKREQEASDIFPRVARGELGPEWAVTKYSEDYGPKKRVTPVPVRPASPTRMNNPHPAKVWEEKMNDNKLLWKLTSPAHMLLLNCGLLYDYALTLFTLVLNVWRSIRFQALYISPSLAYTIILPLDYSKIENKSQEKINVNSVLDTEITTNYIRSMPWGSVFHLSHSQYVY